MTVAHPNRDVVIVFEVEGQRLICHREGERHVVALRPRAHALVRYMACRNAESGTEGVLCTHEELIEAVWPNGHLSHGRNELAKLVLGVRRALDPFEAGALLETARGLGYRLHASSSTAPAGLPPSESSYRSGLPVPSTMFLGRARELEELVSLLSCPDHRLVTLTGPGGTGKTRLGLQAAAAVSESYPDGVFWVPLAPLRNPALVQEAFAQALGIREEPGRKLVETLASRLDGKRVLVLIDNAEHLLPDLAGDVGELVGLRPTGPALLVTSRERLQVPGETVWPVPPLTPEDAEHLFTERARSAGVSLNADGTIMELCRRLDELPLAIELAAARTVVFSPAQLLERLGRRLDLLKGGRGIDARQKTLRATIAWSYDLLDADEQMLFRRLSVFAGACGFESAEQVAGADPDVLLSLLNKSLLRRRDSKVGPRFWMLETIRVFAAEQLAARGETDGLERRFAEHYAGVAEGCFDETLRGSDDLDRLEEERENLRLAVDLAADLDAELALELATRLYPLWRHRGENRQGRETLVTALARASDSNTRSRARALAFAGLFAEQQSDYDAARSLGYEALAGFRALGDESGAGFALNRLGRNAHYRGDLGEGRRLLEESLEAYRAAGEEDIQLDPQENLALLLASTGDVAEAVTRLRAVVAKTRAEGSTVRLAERLSNLGWLELSAGEAEQARRSLEETIALSRQGSHETTLAAAHKNLGHLMRTTEPAEALDHYSRGLRLARDQYQLRVIVACLEGGAAIHAAWADHEHAAHLLGAASAIRSRTGAALSPQEQLEVDAVTEQCRRALANDALVRAWNDGAALDANAAAEWALRAWAARDPGVQTPTSTAKA